jgi:hypothetical protein
MNFNIEKYEDGEWFQFFNSEVLPDGKIKYHDPEPDAGKFKLRQAGYEVIKDIRAKTGTKKSEIVLNPEIKSMERVVFYDQTFEQEKREHELLWDYCIVSWDGIKDSKGNEIPVTLENKLRLVSISSVSRFINRCVEIQNSIEGELRKN